MINIQYDKKRVGHVGRQLAAGLLRQHVFNNVCWRKVMKKKVKKLELNKETVRNLTTDDLKKIAGGTVDTLPKTVCYSCRPTLCP
jgi:cAMP phosphodiesterase